MIREDLELFAELARINSDMASLAMRMMDGSASTVEQARYAQRLITAGKWLQRRVNETAGSAIEGEVIASGSLTLPMYTAESHQEL